MNRVVHYLLAIAMVVAGIQDVLMSIGAHLDGSTDLVGVRGQLAAIMFFAAAVAIDKGNRL